MHMMKTRDAQIEQVNAVLVSIHADKVPRLLVYNKIDLKPELQLKIDRNDFGQVKRVFISAQHGLGMPHLVLAISEILRKGHDRAFHCPYGQSG